MRFQKKYKLFNFKKKNRTIDLPLRILKFKHTKWNSLISFVKNRKRLAYFFRLLTTKKKSNNINIKNRRIKKSSKLIENKNVIKYFSITIFKLQSLLKKWERLSHNHKDSLSFKQYFYQCFNHHIKYKLLKKQIFSAKNLNNKQSFFKQILKTEFRIDILLYKLRFFKSSFETRKFLNENLIKVNGRTIKGNYIVKIGDVITLNHKLKLEYKHNLKRLKKTFLLYNFLEIDYFTGTIIILRSFDKMPESEFCFFFKNYFDIYKFRYSFR